MPEQLRIGIVGCGAIAGNHASAFSALEGATIAGCCDVDLARAEAFATAQHVPAAVDSVSALIDLGVDAITVCTPHPTHEDVVVAAAERGVHVLCEKPIAISADAARRMISACDSAGVTFGVMFQRRFWPAAQRIRAAIDNGRLGQPILGHCFTLLHRESEYYSQDAWRGTWATDGGGVLMTQAVHDIDLLQWFMGPVAEVSGKIATYNHGEHIEVEDSAVATLTFVSGAMATLQASTAATPSLGVSVQVTGSTGATARVSSCPEGSAGVNDVWAVPSESSFSQVFTSDIEIPEPLSLINGRQAEFHALQVADFAAALREDRDPAVTGRDALKSLEIIAAIYDSAHTGKAVRISAPNEL